MIAEQLLHRVFPSMHMITLSSAGPCHNYTGFDPNHICILQDFMPSHILLLLGTSHVVNASRALLRRVFPSMHPITLSPAGSCYNYTGFDPNRICILQDFVPPHILLLLGTSRAVNASRALLRRVFPFMHPITLSSAGPCYN